MNPATLSRSSGTARADLCLGKPAGSQHVPECHLEPGLSFLRDRVQQKSIYKCEHVRFT